MSGDVNAIFMMMRYASGGDQIVVVKSNGSAHSSLRYCPLTGVESESGEALEAIIEDMAKECNAIFAKNGCFTSIQKKDKGYIPVKVIVTLTLENDGVDGIKPSIKTFETASACSNFETAALKANEIGLRLKIPTEKNFFISPFELLSLSEKIEQQNEWKRELLKLELDLGLRKE